MKKLIFLGMIILHSSLLARIIHGKGDIWVGWNSPDHLNDASVIITGNKVGLNIFNHTALDIGNYKPLKFLI